MNDDQAFFGLHRNNMMNLHEEKEHEEEEIIDSTLIEIRDVMRG